MPGTYWTLQRLGMLEKMKAGHFPKKYSVQFYLKTGKASAPFYFFENDPHESSVTWQVLRSEFDQMLFENALEKGANGFQGVTVADALFEGDQAVGVAALFPDGSRQTFHSKVVVDASGQNALISRKLKISDPEPRLKKAAVYSHFEGALRDSGIDEGATLVVHTRNEDSWFWYIPLPDNRVSVGAVGSLDYLIQNRSGEPQQVLEEEIELSDEIKRRISGARQLFPVKVTKEFSYRARKIAGNGWVLVGDAFGFLDPIYSSGVMLAFKSAEMAADAIHDALVRSDFSAERLGRFGNEFVAGMEAVRKLVYAFYTREFSFAQFLKKFPHCRQSVINILVGDVFRKRVDGLFGPLSQMCPLPENKKLEP